MRFAVYAIMLMAMTGGVFVLAAPAFGQTISSARDEQSSIQTSTAADHDMFLQLDAGAAIGINDTLTLRFPLVYTNVLGITQADIDVMVGGADVADGLWNFSSVVNGGYTEIEIEFLSAYAGGNLVEIEIGTIASGGVNQITNPASEGVATIIIEGSFLSGLTFISTPHLDESAVNVSAVVPATTTNTTATTSRSGGANTLRIETDDTPTVIIEGVSASNGQAVLVVNGQVLGAVVIDAQGVFTFELTDTTLSDVENAVLIAFDRYGVPSAPVNLTGELGNLGALAMISLATAPTVSISGGVDAPVVSGVGVPGAVIQVRVTDESGQASFFSTIVGPDGEYTMIVPIGALRDGFYSLDVRMIVDGVVSPWSTPVAVAVSNDQLIVLPEQPSDIPDITPPINPPGLPPTIPIEAQPEILNFNADVSDSQLGFAEIIDRPSPVKTFAGLSAIAMIGLFDERFDDPLVPLPSIILLIVATVMTIVNVSTLGIIRRKLRPL